MSISPKPFRKPSSRRTSPSGGRTSGIAPEQRFGAWTFTLRSAAETGRLGHAIGHALSGGEVIGLCGMLGSGKTTLVRGIAEGLGAAPEQVASPTFVLIHEYHGRLPLIHADLYRLDSKADVSMIGLEEYFNESTVTAVEWADKFEGALPVDRLEILIEHRTHHSRGVSLRASGRSSASLLGRVKTLYRARSTGAERRKRVKSTSALRTRS